MRSEVAVYDAYLRGSAMDLNYKNGVLSDSCWGFIGDLQACKDMAYYLPDECKVWWNTEEQEHPASIIKPSTMPNSGRSGSKNP